MIVTAKSTGAAVHRELFSRARVQPRGPTVVALQRAMARGELDPSTDVALAMHPIQGPLISARIVDDSDVDAADLEAMLDMIVRSLGVSP